ncbi:60539142-918f-41a3-9e87-47dcd1164d9d-CDS [Sclerotinia trifoliorum]|uniref:60539142-918f-41a3-9e87-47dcd1164d9d-CDS n=1 Tax=Sclerotinia trifoliorum TaxID=28548 RepID=A0A8H2W396_9HELO|nr:60539142-918f-41a3-9e87-47dcd1164d9d-CDS [Sclerotinia trifoliorum]
MAEPLLDLTSGNINSGSPSVISNTNNMSEDTSYTENTPMSGSVGSPPSSPLADATIDATNDATDASKENISPVRRQMLSSRNSIDGEHMSPLKLLKSQTSPTKSTDGTRSPRKMSTPMRFPVKPTATPSPLKSPEPPAVVEQEMDLDDPVLRDNEGLTKAIEILEEDDDDNDNEEGQTINETFAYIGTGSAAASAEESHNLMDDTMVSTFSDFSAVPDMTMFSKIGHSPPKFSNMGGPTPRQSHRFSTPATARRQMNTSEDFSPTPYGHRNVKSKDDGNTTNLLDFTAQMNGFSGRGPSPSRHRMSPSKSSAPDQHWYAQNTAATPKSNRMSNLLDFDIPPAPTPRSLPSVTPREIERLKSDFLSEISTLKATLSGKEAELQFMKTAVADAEKRVGESLEQLREERNLQDQLAAEKEEWEKRGREMEAVLRNVREEMVQTEQEREELDGRLEESERRREMAEIMAQEAQRNLAAMRAGKATPGAISPPAETSLKLPAECHCGGRTVEIAVEKVSRELHALYKEKHETKVQALKKSYERRWDKRVKELEATVEELTKENEDLRLGHDNTTTKVESSAEDVEKQAARDARTRELEAELEGLGMEIKSVRQDNEDLRHMLEEERIEKTKLVQAVDEMIPMIAMFDDMVAKNLEEEKKPAPTRSSPIPETPVSQKKQHVFESHMKSPTLGRASSVSRPSGLRAPSAAGGSRIGRGGMSGIGTGLGISGVGRERKGSNGSVASQGSRPGSGLSGRSNLLSSIDKMGGGYSR